MLLFAPSKCFRMSMIPTTPSHTAALDDQGDYARETDRDKKRMSIIFQPKRIKL